MSNPEDTDKLLAFASTVPPSAPDTIPAFDPPDLLETWGEPTAVPDPKAPPWKGGEFRPLPEPLHDGFAIVRPVTFLPQPTVLPQAVEDLCGDDLWDLSSGELDDE